MAAGFTPKFTDTITLNNISKHHFLVIAVNAVKTTGWDVTYISQNGLIAYTNKGMFATNAQIEIVFKENGAAITSASTGNEMIDFGRNKKNVAKYIAAFNSLKNTKSTEELDVEFEELSKYFPSADTEDILLAEPISGLKSVLNIFTPVKGYYITPILVLLNVVIFIIMLASGINFMDPSPESMLQWGANFKPSTLNGEGYRLFTNFFLHFGIMHLLLNMYALVYIGMLLEPRLGRLRFLSAYLLAGLISSVASLWWNDYVVSAGASGAIFGMYGVFLALLTTNMIEPSVRKALFASIGVFVVINLFSGMAHSGIDNAAHIGGLVSGLIIGFLFIPGLKKPASAQLKFGGIALGCLITLIALFVGYSNTSNDLGKYDAKIKLFGENETKALAVYQLHENAPKDLILTNIKDIGIVYWKENLKLIKDADKLDLPESLHKQNAKLEKYCTLRLESYNLLYKSITEDTRAYDYRLNELNKDIEAIIKEITATAGTQNK